MPAPSHDLGPFAALIGYRVSAWRKDMAEVTLEVEARHMNRTGLLHGGVLATLIDTACGHAGSYRPPPGEGRRALTLALTTEFVGPVAVGAHLTASGRRTGGGRRIYFAHCEVRDQDGRLVATGSGTFRYRSGG